MKVLIVLPSLKRAGAETQTVDLANGLSERGHSVLLSTFDSERDQESRVSHDVQLHRFVRNGRYDRQLVRSLSRLMDEESVEVVLGVMQYASLYAWRAALGSSVRPPVAASIHTTVNLNLKAELQDRILYRRLLARLPATIFVCESQRKHWLRKYPELRSKAKVIYNGVDPGKFRRNQLLVEAQELRRGFNIPDDAVVFACIAAFRPEKGHEILVEALSQASPGLHLLLAGDGVCRARIESKVALAGLSNRVHFLGNMADVRPVIVASNATVLASTAVETFSMAMLESMALAVPVIAPEIGGLAEAIDHGRTGYLFPIGDTNSLAKILREVGSDPKLLLKLGAASELLVREKFSRERMVTSTEELLADLCTRWGAIA